MPQTSHRLDLLLVPAKADREAALAWMARQRLDGVLDARGFAAARADTLVAGGFARVRVDDPGGLVLYGNQLGGFRVTCPSCGGNLVPVFMSAWRRRRGGGSGDLDCGACGSAASVDTVVTAPPVAVGRLAVVVADAGSAALRQVAAADLAAYIGSFRTVWRRAT